MVCDLHLNDVMPGKLQFVLDDDDDARPAVDAVGVSNFPMFMM